MRDFTRGKGIVDDFVEIGLVRQQGELVIICELDVREVLPIRIVKDSSQEKQDDDELPYPAKDDVRVSRRADRCSRDANVPSLRSRENTGTLANKTGWSSNVVRLI